MALNFGLGFSFSGQDAGLGKAINGLSKDFRTLGKEMLGLQRLQTMLAALSFDRLGDLSDKLKAVSTGGMELTTSFEETMVSFDKETRKLGASFGKSGAEMKKFKQEASSMAYSMGIGADQAGKALYGFEAQVGDLKAADILKGMGIDSAKTLAKLAEVAGVSGDKFSYSLLQMGKASGITGKDVSEITDMLTKFGTTIADPTAALGKLDEITDLLGKRKMLGDNPEQVAAFGKGIIASADAFYAVFQNGDKALSFATSLSTALTDNKGKFQSLVAGAESALPELTKAIAVGGTGIEDAFRSMSQGPDVFLKNFAEKVGQLSEGDAFEAMKFFKAHAMSAFGDAGEGVVKMLQTAEGRAALTNTNVKKMIEESSKATGKLAKDGFTTGFSEAKQFEMQQEQFVARFRKLGTRSGQEFLAETGKSFKVFGDILAGIAADGGPLGLVVGKMADVAKYGAAGLFPPNIQAPLIALTSAADAMIGPLAKLRSLGINLLSPWGAVFGIFATLAAMFTSEFMNIWTKMAPKLKKEGKKTTEIMGIVAHQAVQNLGKKLLDFMQKDLPGYVSKAVKFVSDFARKVLSGGLMQGSGITGNEETDAVLQSLMTVFKDAFNKAVVFLKDMAGGLWDGIVGNVVDPAKASDGAVIGAAIGVMLRKAFDFVVDSISGYFSDWWDRMVVIWNDPNKTFMEKVKAWFGESLPILIGAAILSAAFLGPIIASLAFTFAVLAVKILMFGGTLVTTLLSVFASIAGRLLTPIKWLVRGVGMLLKAAISTASAGILAVSAVVTGFFVGMFKMAQEEGDNFGETWARMWANIFTTVQWYGDHIGNFLSFIGTNALIIFENLGAGIINAFMWAFDGVRSAFIGVFNFIAGYTNKLAEAISKPLTSVMQTIGDMLSWLASSPKLADFFGIDPKTMEGIKGAGEYLKGIQSGDVAGALKDDLIPEPEKFVPLQMRALRGLDSNKVESLGSRQRAVGAVISEDRDARIASEKRDMLTPGGRPKVSPKESAPEGVPPALLAALDDPSWTKAAAGASAEQIKLLTDIKVALERLGGAQPTAKPATRPVPAGASPPVPRTPSARRG